METSPSTPTFREGLHPYQRTQDGITFPKILLPRSLQEDGVVDLVRQIQSSSEWLQEQLHRHSAILFRGFLVQTAEDFAAVSQAFGWEPRSYDGLAVRREVLNGIYTANEGPVESEIWLHHEMAQSGGPYPSKILFFCEIEPSKGGETPIVLSHRATDRIKAEYPDFIDMIEKQGLVYNVHLQSHNDQSSMIGKGWRDIFNTNDEVEAEKRAERYSATLEWLPDNRAKFTQGPLPATRSFREDGREVWFNNMVGVYKPGKENITYGDGSQLPADAVYGCAKILQEEAVAIPWCRGDVLLLDNLAVLHGKRPAEPPRRILVSLYT